MGQVRVAAASRLLWDAIADRRRRREYFYLPKVTQHSIALEEIDGKPVAHRFGAKGHPPTGRYLSTDVA
jgi:hypothetical protein